MARVEQANELGEKIDGVLGQLGGTPAPAVASEARRRLFGDYARLWNDAEVAGDNEAMATLQEIRPKLKISPPKRRGKLVKVSMVLRMVLTMIVVFYGCLWLVLLGPLRLLHPLLRSCGFKNGKLPMDVLTGLLFRAALATMGVNVVVDDGSVKQWGDRPCGIIVYNHGSNIDPFVVNMVTRWCASPKYVGKKDLFKIPLFGWMSLVIGQVPINRGDRDKARQALNDAAAAKMRDWGRCVAISPEGTRSTDGHLTLPFKKGVFHLEEQTGAPLMPVVIHGAFEIWPPSQLFPSTGELKVSILPPLKMPDGEKARESARIELQSTYAERLNAHADWSLKPLSGPAMLKHMIIVALTFAIIVASSGALGVLVSMFGLGAWGVFALLLVVSIVEAVWVDRFF